MSLFDLPRANDIDYINTVRALKQFFKDYKILRVKAGERKFPTLTTTYTITPPVFSNQFNSKVEDAAIHNIDTVQVAQDVVKKYDVIINQLEHFQRKIIIECFIHDSRDIDVMIDMPYEEAQYKREKRKGVIQLATTLGIEVLKQK
ncbi:ArpU family phage packaging/lysis transcriptional regulator [Paenilisteria rocourtiae]|uniref:ArpU family phage transcriptional regulator n=1 Tax=Listeria rocourtiae TaxID=647910 RepID=A0A4R6ZNU3_9LIST|nr:ArpU family phage packaging/lysis transcriptional regulator [Listeria rocourtiae]EUJ51809.1 gp66 [Listeria rocourtiae FSL F6-920]TDR54201.1 ArpU family phage transcriptional regulator [Listeria rocourtiae]